MEDENGFTWTPSTEHSQAKPPPSAAAHDASRVPSWQVHEIWQGTFRLRTVGQCHAGVEVEVAPHAATKRMARRPTQREGVMSSAYFGAVEARNK
jgi:hypothetical protein